MTVACDAFTEKIFGTYNSLLILQNKAGKKFEHHRKRAQTCLSAHMRLLSIRSQRDRPFKMYANYILVGMYKFACLLPFFIAL